MRAMPTSGRQLLRLLIVDDDPDDVATLLRCLRAAGLHVWHERIDGPNELRLALEVRSWDAILCEYRMNDFDATEAFLILRSFPLDLPFIVTSETMLEDAAVDLLRRGAHDFVSRQNLDRLAPAIVREVADGRQRRERHRAEQALRDSEAKARTILNAAADAIVTVDEEGNVESMNPAATRLFRADLQPAGVVKVSAILARSTPEPLLPILRSIALTAPELPVELTALRFDGTSTPVELTVSELTSKSRSLLLCFLRDVSRRLSLESQLRRSQKLDALGHLSAGIAHDFNNVLNIVLAHAELGIASLNAADASGTAPDLAVVGEDLSHIVHAAERGASITKRLLVFSRRGDMSPRVVDLRSIVSDMHEMLAPCVGAGTQFRLDLCATPCLAKIDPGFLEQAVLNLVVNARDAMPGGGQLHLTLRRATFRLPTVIGGTTIPWGDYIVVAIRDTGTGMSEDVVAKIFEPFFTTKPSGHGTGLGLATVYGFVKQSSGHVSVQSEIGRGSTFSLFLPETSEPVEIRADGPLPGGRSSETVLLVEDNDMLRVATRRLLEGHGYRVLEAASHEDVLRRCRTFSGPIHLLLSDIVLPDVDGITLAGRARQVRPDLRVLLTTGYFEPTNGRTIPYRVLQKPCTTGELLLTVRTTLDEVLVGA